MIKLFVRFLKHWDLLLAVAAASIGYFKLEPNILHDITTELIAFFSIQSAVILPAMIFTAGILKPDGLEVDELDRYHKALKMQMRFWVTLLSLDFVAVAALIIGKGADWSIVVNLPHMPPVDISSILPATVFLAGTLAVVRTAPFVHGVMSLLDLNSDLAKKAIIRRNKRELKEHNAKATTDDFILPEGYGKVVEHD
jgi:hypothetical protein